MKNKKSDKANLENKKGILFLIGLVFSLGLVLVSFEWKSSATKSNLNWETNTFIQEDFLYIPPTQRKEKELPKQKTEVPFIDIVENTADIVDNANLFSSDPQDEVLIDFSKIMLSEDNTEEEVKEDFLLYAEEMPEFPGGEKALVNFLASSVKYPAIAQENGIQGKVFVSFIIDEYGNINQATIVRGVDTSLDNEALRVVQLMPKWKPGKQGGKTVKVKFNVPINFELR